MKCPACGSHELLVYGYADLKVTHDEDGEEVITLLREPYYEFDSFVRCENCDYEDMVKTFERTDHE